MCISLPFQESHAEDSPRSGTSRTAFVCSPSLQHLNMGLCGSSDADKEDRNRNRHVEKLLLAARKADYDVIKLLFLGAGESGKSTLFKQMVSIYGKGFPEAERKGFVDTIRRNVLNAMKTLCEQSDVLAQRGVVQSTVQRELLPSKQWVLDSKENTCLTPDVGEHLHALWHDAGIRETYKNRHMFQLADNFNFFFDRVKEISDPDYIPTEDDVLRCRIRTTGIVEQDFDISNNTFRFVDVGGQVMRLPFCDASPCQLSLSCTA